MNKDTKALLGKILIATVAIGFIILFLVMGASQDSATPFTVYSKSRNGLMAIHDTLTDIGVSVQVCMDPLSDSLPDGTLFILSPLAPPSAAEIEVLKNWVARGNTLVCSATGDKLPKGGTYGIPTEPHSGTKSTPELECLLTKDVKSLRVRTLFDEISDTFSFGDLSYLPQVGIGSRFQEDTQQTPKDNDAVAMLNLFSVSNVPVAGIAAWGKGRVIVVGDPQCFTNILVGKDDNAIFLSNILQTSGKTGKRIAIFYEYGNGYERLIPGVGLLRLIDKPVRTGLIVFTVAFLLMVVLEAQRFGPVRQLMERTRFRSEYLGSLADLLRRGGGTDVALDELGLKFIQDVNRQLGLSNNTDIALVVSTAQNRGLDNHILLHKLLQEAGRTHESVSDDNALMVARQWHKMRKEISTLR